ncbi:hypothetical protein Dimus_008865 [Dionaea muscipula]
MLLNFAACRPTNTTNVALRDHWRRPVLNQTLTIAETMRFNYSADISDYLLYCHNILFLFVLFGFSLATLPVAAAAAELLSSASFDRYKIQPKVKLSSSETFNYYMTVMKLFFLIVGPLQLVSYLP